MQDSFTAQTLFQSPQETATFAADLAPFLHDGDVILLSGEIGAGKSHFARSLIQKRLAEHGLNEDVPSPTFTLVQTYNDSKCDIWHADLYRLNGPADVDDLGLWDAFDTAICLVEWPDRLGNSAPENALSLTLTAPGNPGSRSALFHTNNPEWTSRLVKLGLANER
ncbi:MAG TPA: tRNA (adenosine(37)-N6)-threonylcarbamoyltransferase complex ATPase subunit type 1 TsaE [Aliiroseovarius sp.]|nr:tRNA (adenosine(37)-N6)-threonylcarbamoyltransferase complex ATPase subunit type 1 TsaE [Aliiroseovarius sp.]